MAFTYKLVLEDGTLADPPTVTVAVPDWKPGHTIPLGPGKALRVVSIKSSEDPVGDPVLVVEPV